MSARAPTWHWPRMRLNPDPFNLQHSVPWWSFLKLADSTIVMSAELPKRIHCFTLPNSVVASEEFIDKDTGLPLFKRTV